MHSLDKYYSMKKKYFYTVMFVLFCLTTQNMFSEDSGSKKNHFDSKFFEIKPIDFKKDSSFSLYADEKMTFAAD